MKSKTSRGQQTQSSRLPQESKSDHKVEREKSHPGNLKGKVLPVGNKKTEAENNCNC